MRKLFFTLCFISIFLQTSHSHSAVRSIVDDGNPQQDGKSPPIKNRTTPERPRFETQEEVVDYIKERMQTAVVTEIKTEEARDPSSINIQPSTEQIEAINDTKKPFFQQVYEQAMERVSQKPEKKSGDLIRENAKIASQNKQEEQWGEPDYKSVNIVLPGGNKVLVPAIEHIPYLMSDIEILSNGLIKINEKVIVVANGEKLKNGLSKSLPRFSVSRSGEKTNLNINLVSVKVNRKEIEYKIEEFGNNLILSPKNKYTLEPGTYTYDFEYIVDRQISKYDDFRELYWNITGNNWNLIVARAGTIIRMPGDKPDIGHTGFINNNNKLDTRVIRTVKSGDNILGFIATRPVFVGESMGVIISIPDDNFTSIDLDKKIYFAIDDYGNIILSLLGLIAIAGGYFVSWIFISDNKSNSKYLIHRNGPIFRYLIKGFFDKLSFGAFLLDLYKKNIIDIKPNQIIKTTDNLSGLNKNEKIAVASLFPNKDANLDINKSNILRLNRAYSTIEKDTKERIRDFLIKINSGYIIFSIAMLLLTQVGIAMLGYDQVYNMAIMISADITVALSFAIFLKKFNSKVLACLYKTFATLLILTSFALLVSTINIYTASLVIITIYAIFAYTNIFSNRNGLIKSNIKDARIAKEKIVRDIDSICFGKNFVYQQPNIFALELTEQFRDRMKDKDFYKLDIVDNIIKSL